jgi:hypothetical protein
LRRQTSVKVQIDKEAIPRTQAFERFSYLLLFLAIYQRTERVPLVRGYGL